MPSRGYLIPAIALWLGSTGWLLTTKILPTLSSGSPPDYGEILPRQAVTLEPLKWAIRWNEREIGWAENRISRSIDGTGKVVSEVQFEQLPVSELIHDVLGVVGRLAGPMFTTDLGPIDLRVLTNLNFDHYGTLSRFDTIVDVGTIPELLQIEGTVTGELLDLSAYVQSGPGDRKRIYHDQVRLPPDVLFADTFSPRPQLTNLRVGQSWTFQSYRPLMPHDPLELIEAKVEDEQLIDWNGQLVKTKVVAYRGDAGSGLSSTRTPMSRAWVTDDGRVLRQDISLANIRVQFVRLPRGSSDGSRTESAAASSNATSTPGEPRDGTISDKTFSDD